MNIPLKNRVLSIFIPLFLITVSLLLAYSNSFHSPFYFDDYGYVVGNTHVEISALSFENLRNSALKSPISKRVLPNISFALNHYFLGSDVFGFHLVNLVLHWLTTLAVFLLFKNTLSLPQFKDNIPRAFEISLLAAILWGCHPLHTNAVTYIVQRMTCMATLFTVTSLLCYIKGRTSLKGKEGKPWVWFPISCLFGFFALISKENSVMLPLLILAYEMFFLSETNWIRDIKKTVVVSVLCIAVLFLLTYIYLDGNVTSLLDYSARNFTLKERLLTEPRVVIFYLSLFFLPLPSRLTLFHDISISHGLFAPAQTILALCTLILLVAGGIFFYKRCRLLSFAIFWFLINLVVESSIIPLEIIYEHRTYLPSIFLPLVLLVFLYNTIPLKNVCRSVAATLICLLIILTWQRNVHWSDTVIFWQDAARKAPNISRTHLGAYFALKAKGEKQESFKALQKAFEVDPGNLKALIPLVDTYNSQKQFSSVLVLLNKHLSVKETADGYIERAKVYAFLKNMPQAIKDAEKALQLRSNSTLALFIKGKALASMGKRKKALENFVQAQKHGLDSAVLNISIGEVYINSGKAKLAIHYFKKGIEKDPNNASGHYYLGLAYGQTGQNKEAKREMAIGLQLQENPIKKSTDYHDF